MKHFPLLKKLLLICLLPAAGTANAQVLNGDFNHLLEFRQAESNANFGTRGHTINFYALKATLSNNNGNPIYTTPFSTLCHNYSSSGNPEVAKAILTSTFSNADASNQFKLNLSIRRYRKNSNSANTCTYTTASTADQLVLEQAYFINDPRSYEKTSGNFSDITLSNGISFTRYRSYWRYAAGNGINGALQFGNIPIGTTRFHDNNNYAYPYNDYNYIEYGYANNERSFAPNLPQTNNFQNSEDVSYSFSLTEPGFVTISTDDPYTNFDSYLTLVRRNNNGTSRNYDIVQSNDNGGSNNKAKITTLLCTGDYVVVVEGKDGSSSTNGNFKLTIHSQSLSAGAIETGHTIPNPQELIPDYITSISGPNTPATFSWQKSPNGNNNSWETIPNSDTIAYRLPATTASAYYQRNANFSCVLNGREFASVNLQTNRAFIRVVTPDGIINGMVRSQNGNPVAGIPVTATRVGTLEGSPPNFTYHDTTDVEGNFSFERMYFGRTDTASEASFIVQANKLNHIFNNNSIAPRRLTNNSRTGTLVTIIDSTVYSITGRTYQKCAGCLDINNDTTTIEGALDSVNMRLVGTAPSITLLTKTGYLNPPDSFGMYAFSVTDPGNYIITPTFKNHKFLPVSKNVRVDGDVANVNFEDTTTFTISGRLTAGCNDYIGTAVIEFYDLLPKNGNGDPRTSQFRKRVTTNAGSGFYSIRLPARKYAAKIISFDSNGDVMPTDLKSFFDVRLPLDSVTRDISVADTTLNFVYNRPPTLDIVGLTNVCNAPQPFAIIEQSEVKQITVFAYQGAISKNCPAVNDTLIINTNIQKDDDNEEIGVKLTNGSALVSLKGGIPNISGNHIKPLNIVFNDSLGRTVTLTRNVVVTGLKSDIGSFTTVSPQVPIMVLHDPPGDQSYSFWETTKSTERATRFYSSMGGEATAWAEVKVGTKISTGLVVSTESEVWGKVKGSVTVAGRVNKASEAIMSTSTSEYFSTAGNPEIIGDGGDVFIGAAINLLYAPTNDLTFNPATCSLSLKRRLMVAPNGFGTQYIYSETHIRKDVLVILRQARDEATTQAQRDSVQNQINVWEQVLANNEQNKKRAVFDHNKSVDGSTGAYRSSTTTTSTKSNTIEFDLAISAEVALELGLEVGGSGVSGGVNVGFKMETGESETNTSMNATTIGFEIDDDDLSPEKYTINIKRDPVYNSPVFEVVAATTSCPYEPGTQPRDAPRLTISEPVKTNIPANGEAEFILMLGNVSQSAENRTYRLSFIQSSNTSGAIVKIGGRQSPFEDYTIPYLGEIPVVVTVQRSASSSIFSYEGLEFKLTDACDGSIEKRVRISAFFVTTCSPIELVQPEAGWISNVADNNIIPIIFKGYTVAGTTSVTLQYQRSVGGWINGPVIPAAQLNNSSNGTQVNWNVSGLPDGSYNLRMKLNCPAGEVYSLRSSGIIDRVSPVAIGNPEPTDDEFVRGDQIIIQYNEQLDCSGVTPEDVQLRRLSNGQLVQANVGCFQNKIVIVPLTDISAFTGDSMKVSVANISDVNGNGKTVPDTWGFRVGNSVTATGPRALSVTPAGGPGGAFAGKAILSGPTISVLEDGGVPIKFVLQLGANAANDMLINYSISGNAVFQKDYNIDYSQNQNLATVFNGSGGSMTLKKGTNKIELIIITIPNQQFEPDKTISITLQEGGDYLFGANITATGIILNDDTPKVYTFTGSGNYNVPANWDNNIVPPLQVLTGDEVIIDPPMGGECILNVPVTIMPGAKFEVKPGKVLRINNALQLKKKL